MDKFIPHCASIYSILLFQSIAIYGQGMTLNTLKLLHDAAKLFESYWQSVNQLLTETISIFICIYFYFYFLRIIVV